MSTRNGDLATIHIRKAELGLGDDEYRDLLFAIQRVRSAKELDFTGRKTVLEHFAKIAKARGIVFKKGAKGARAHNPLSREQRMVRALWIRLAREGKLRDRSDRALDAFVKRMAHVDRLEWLGTGDARVVIEALKAWCAREGLETV